MIPLTNHDFQWGRSEVVIIYPDKLINTKRQQHILHPQQGIFVVALLVLPIEVIAQNVAAQGLRCGPSENATGPCGKRKTNGKAEKKEKPLEKTGKKTSWDFILWDLVFVEFRTLHHHGKLLVVLGSMCVWLKILAPDFHAKMPAYGWFVDVIQQMPFQNKKHQGFYSVKIGISAPNMRIQRSMQTPHSWGQMVGHCMTSRSKSWLSKQVWSSTMWGMDTVYAIREYMYIYRYEGFHYLVYN